ncbi:FkbM family methyltransferase [Pararcticibacter amylolyticus]|uniref:FkbM family methyltransferase n=1 Tax=Pararcticibacter amylolyticus TaxID=2173175 RepID=UPI001305006C|nr:FkbM family methyltransferase [Pararcticibacter amylolyticus]
MKIKINIIEKTPFFKRKKEQQLFVNHFTLLSYISTFQESCFKRLFGTHAKSVLFETHNGALLSSPMDTEINRRLGHHGQYDLDKIHFLNKIIKKDYTVYFLGVHIGTLLIPLSYHANKVIGFEANPDTFEYLKYNLLLNNVSNAAIFNLGVYDKYGTSLFYKNKANTGGSKIKPHSDQFIYNYDQPTETIIKTVCLDDFVSSNGLPYPDVMIVDIEGAEYAALKMAGQCLSNCKYLYIEFVPHHLSNVANIDVNEFLSVIVPYFTKMVIVNSPNHGFYGEDIYKVLADLYAREVCVDLLFFNL